MAVLMAVAEGRLVPPSQRAPQRSIPWELEQVVLRAMATNPAQRYQAAAALRGDVVRFLDGRTLAAVAYTRGQRLAKWVGRHRRWVAAGGATAALMGLAGLVSLALISAAHRTERGQRRTAEASARAARAARVTADRAAAAARAERTRALAAETRARSDLALAQARLVDAMTTRAERLLVDRRLGEAGLLLAAAQARLDRPALRALRLSFPPMTAILERVLACPVRDERVRGLDLSPDGRRLAVVAGARLDLWDLTDARPRPGRSIRFDRELPHALRHTPDGRSLVVGFASGFLVRLDARTLKVVAQARGDGPVRALAISPDGRWLATAVRDAQLRAVADLALDGRYHAPRFRGSWLEAITFTRDGRQLISAGSDRLIRCWRVGRSDAPQSGWDAHEGAVHALLALPDGRTVLSAGADRQLLRWSLATSPEPGRPAPPIRLASSLRALREGPDGMLVAATERGAAILLDTEGRLIQQLTGHGGAVPALAVHPGTRRLATAGRGRILLWRLRDGVRERVRTPVGAWLQCVALSPDGRVAVAGGSDGWLTSVDLVSGRRVVTRPHRTRITGVDIARDRRIVTVSLDGQLQLYGTDGQRTAVLPQPGPLSTVRFSPGAPPRYVAVVDTERVPDRPGRFRCTTARVLALAGQREVARLAVAPVRGPLAWHPDGRRLAVATSEGVLVWSVPQGRAVRRVRCAGVLALAVSRSGRWLAVAGQRVGLLDLTRPAEGMRWLGDLEVAVNTLAWGPQDRLLASGDERGTLVLWEPVGGQRLRSLEGHGRSIVGLAFGPDGALVSVSLDGRLRAWGLDAPRDTDHARRLAGLALDGLRTRPLTAQALDRLRRRAALAPPALWERDPQEDYRRGWLQLRDGQHALAHRTFTRLIAQAPEFWRGYVGRAMARIARGRGRAAALADLREAQSRAGDDAEVQRQIQVQVRRAERLPEAPRDQR